MITVIIAIIHHSPTLGAKVPPVLASWGLHRDREGVKAADVSVEVFFLVMTPSF